MPGLNETKYIIVNIWPVDENEPLKDRNIAHVSILTHDNGTETYTSIFSGDHPCKTGFLQKREPLSRAIFSDFTQRPSSYKQDYEQDCALEAMHRGQVRHISHIKKCTADETPFLISRVAGTLEKLTTQPKKLQPGYQICAIKLIPASIRVVLYSLDLKEVKTCLDALNEPNHIPGWFMAGSNLYTRDLNFNRNTTQNCMSIASLCLVGLPVRNVNLTNLPRNICPVSLKSLPKHSLLAKIVAAKWKESTSYIGDPVDWKVSGLDEKSKKDLLTTSKSAPNLNPSDQLKREYQKARGMLEQLCKNYIGHNKSKLDKLSTIRCAAIHACISENKEISTNCHERTYDNSLSQLIQKLNFLLMQSKLIHLNKKPYFNKKLVKYLSNNKCLKSDSPSARVYKNLSKNKYLESDPPSVRSYKNLMYLKTLMGSNTLPQYNSKKETSLSDYFNELLPALEEYIKGIAVQELRTILNDATFNHKKAIHKVDLQLKNPITLEILGKNHQSQAEQILKALFFVLIPLSIGIIGIVPTLFLAGKRLYDSGGTSLNFFKLPEKLCEDANKITSNLDLSEDIHTPSNISRSPSVSSGE